MNVKDKSEFEVGGFRVKVIRREMQSGPDRIDVNIYSNPEGTTRDYEQYNFRVIEDQDANIARFNSKREPQPSTTALRALYEYGWACENFDLDDVIEKEDMETVIRTMLAYHEKLDVLTSQDPTLNRLVNLSGRVLQHGFGYKKNAEYYDGKTVTEFMEMLSQDNYTADYERLLDFDDEMRVAMLFVDRVIEEEHEFSFIDEIGESVGE